jgi:hypothetical protein
MDLPSESRRVGIYGEYEDVSGSVEINGRPAGEP